MDETRFREVEKGLVKVSAKAAYEAGQSAMWRKQFDKKIDKLPEEISNQVVASLPCAVQKLTIKHVKVAIGALWGIVLLLIAFIIQRGG